MKVALVGVPNAGKSSLFNRLVWGGGALVHNEPGLTRDWRMGKTRDGWQIVDTAGWSVGDGELEEKMREGTLQALERVDVAVVVVDGVVGVGMGEEELVREIRRLGVPMVVCVNKCDRKDVRGRVWEAGVLGEMVGVSAEHGDGIGGLWELVARASAGVEEKGEPEREEGAGRVVLLGRPNVGKSTLMNALVGETRVLAGEQAGMTRDVVEAQVAFGGVRLDVADTAGVRRVRKGLVEDMAVDAGLAALRRVEVAVLVLDARDPLNRQDLRLAGEVGERGRGVVCVLNKSDLLTVAMRKRAMRETRALAHKLAPTMRGISVVCISAREGWGLKGMVGAVQEVRKAWRKKVQAAALNRWLKGAMENHMPPAPGGKPTRLKYVAQVGTAPPRFLFFTNRRVPETYKRYLRGSVCETFSFGGVPVRIEVQVSDNPYHQAKSKGKRR